MATVTGLTAARMQEMEDATIIDGNIVGDDLVLLTKDGTPINAGNVRGPVGPSGSGYLVCTSSTRPSLGTGDEGIVIYETDTDLVRIWTGTRWRVQEKIVCTSTTRPTGLGTADEGVNIYETDTNLEFTWSGSAWVPASWNPTFTSSSDRNTKWPSPPRGATSYLTDTDSLWVFNGTVWVKQAPSWAQVLTSQSWNINAFGDLLTPGPIVTAATGASALVTVSCNIFKPAGGAGFMGFAVSGATTISPLDAFSLIFVNPVASSNAIQASYTVPVNLTPGVNVFTAKYKAVDTSVTFAIRTLSVMPL